jgi:hypothetical protein
MKLNITLEDESSKRFQAVKEHTGMKSDLSVLQYAISREYGRARALMSIMSQLRALLRKSSSSFRMDLSLSDTVRKISLRYTERGNEGP